MREAYVAALEEATSVLQESREGKAGYLTVPITFTDAGMFYWETRRFLNQHQACQDALSLYVDGRTEAILHSESVYIALAQGIWQVIENQVAEQDITVNKYEVEALGDILAGAYYKTLGEDTVQEPGEIALYGRQTEAYLRLVDGFETAGGVLNPRYRKYCTDVIERIRI